MDKAYRYAVYFTHAPHSEWARAGNAWLGRGALPGGKEELAPSPAQALLGDEAWSRLVADPRRYGWHATLRAPFRLAPGCTLDALRKAVTALCRELHAFEMPALEVHDLGFLALTPQARDRAALDNAARACVESLHRCAAPLTEQELARRRKASLTPAQDALLMRWGYPFVMEEFRFHFSLTGPLAGLAAEQIHALADCARRYFGALPSARFDALTLFAEPVQGGDFMALERVPLSV